MNEAMRGSMTYWSLRILRVCTSRSVSTRLILACSRSVLALYSSMLTRRKLGTVPLIYIFAAAKVQINEDITKQSYLFFLLLLWIIQELLLPLQTNNQCTFKHQYILHENEKNYYIPFVIGMCLDSTGPEDRPAANPSGGTIEHPPGSGATSTQRR